MGGPPICTEKRGFLLVMKINRQDHFDYDPLCTEQCLDDPKMRHPLIILDLLSNNMIVWLSEECRTSKMTP